MIVLYGVTTFPVITVEAIKDVVDQASQYRLSSTPCAKMILKLVLEFVVIFSLINSIQCACKGTQAIFDAIDANLQDIRDLSEKIKTLDDSCSPSSKFYTIKVFYFIIRIGGKDCKELKDKGISTSGKYTINPDGGVPFEVSNYIISISLYTSWYIGILRYGDRWWWMDCHPEENGWICRL